MVNFLGLPTTIIGWATTIGFIVTGIFALITLFDRGRKQKQDDTDRADDRLINLVKETNVELEKKVKVLQDSDVEKGNLISKLQGKNELLEKIFQGRDDQTQQFQKQGFEAMKKTEIVIKEMVGINKNIERLAEVIERHLESFTPSKTIKTTKKVETIK